MSKKKSHLHSQIIYFFCQLRKKNVAKKQFLDHPSNETVDFKNSQSKCELLKAIT